MIQTPNSKRGTDRGPGRGARPFPRRYRAVIEFTAIPEFWTPGVISHVLQDAMNSAELDVEKLSVVPVEGK